MRPDLTRRELRALTALLLIAAPATLLVAARDACRPPRPPAARPLRLDVNRATRDALQALPGVGPKTANRIALARPFRTLQELRELLGERRFRRVEPYVACRPLRWNETGAKPFPLDPPARVDSMKIGLKPREQSHKTCPYCHDGVVRGPTCSACGAQYHVECAETFGKCAARGCAGTFAGIAEQVQPIPRLALLARRIDRWQTSDLTASPAAVVVLMPTPRERHTKRAAEVIGEVLGQTAYDGRLRLGSAYPEPLVRVSDPARLDAILDKMRGAGLTVIAPRLADVVAPLRPFDVTDVLSLGDPLRFADGEGHEVAIPRGTATFAVRTQVQELERASGGPLMADTSSFSGGGYQRGRSSKRIATRKPDHSFRQLALYLFLPSDPRPVVLKEKGLRDFQILGRQKTVSTHHNMKALIDAIVAHGGEVQEMAKTIVLNQALLVTVDHLGNKRSNEPVVALVARLMRLAWEAERQGR